MAGLGHQFHQSSISITNYGRELWIHPCIWRQNKSWAVGNKGLSCLLLVSWMWTHPYFITFTHTYVHTHICVCVSLSLSLCVSVCLVQWCPDLLSAHFKLVSERVIVSSICHVLSAGDSQHDRSRFQRTWQLALQVTFSVQATVSMVGHIFREDDN